MNHVLVVAEQYKGKVARVSLELLGIARELAKDGKVSAVLMGEDIREQADLLAGYGADAVHVLDDKAFGQYTTEGYAAGAYAVIRKVDPDIVLFGATSTGRDLAPRLSARLGTGLTADCTKLEIGGDGKLLMTRPAFGGNLFATIVCPDHRPQMSTVRPGVMNTQEFDGNRKAKIIIESTKDIKPAFPLKITAETAVQSKEKDIIEAKVLVSCGRGASGKDTLAAAAELARILGGVTSSSRALVDAQIMPHAKQVGQTGKTVRPMIYIASGISGAVQHLAGMSESDYVVAINRDAAAPIFGVANLGIVGDASKILPELVAAVKEIQEHKQK